MRKLTAYIIFTTIFFSVFCQKQESINAYEMENSGYFSTIIPCKHGIISGSNNGNDIYLINNNNIETLVSAPGCARYMNLHPNENHILFKYIDKNLKQQAASLNLKTKKIEFLTSPQNLCGQAVATKNGDIFIPSENHIFIYHLNKSKDSIKTNFYSNFIDISPDEKQIVCNNNSDELIIIDIKTKKAETIYPQTAFTPKFSPNGQFIAFACPPANIGIINVDDRSTSIIDGTNFAWHPSENKIIYNKINANKQEITSCEIETFDIQNKTFETIFTGEQFSFEPRYDKNGNIYFHNGPKQNIFKISTDKIETIFEKQSTIPRSFYNPVRDIQSDVLVPGEVPYIHQVYDTPSWHSGGGSCAPTTTIMALAYYNRLPKWTTSVDHGKTWDPHTNDYGAYVADKYRFNETFYDEDADAYGTTAYGAFGYMWKTGYSPNSTMKNFIINHNLSSNQYWTSSCDYTSTISEISNDYVHPLCNYLTSVGHLTLCIGYVNNQHTLIFNDPYGNKNTPNYPSYDGQNAYYDWPGYNNGFQNLGGSNNTIAWTVAARTQEPEYSDTIIDDVQYGHGFYINNSENGSHARFFRDFNCGYNNHTWYTIGVADKEVCYVSWSPNIEGSKWMKVSAFIPQKGSNTKSAFYKIHAANIDTVVKVNQSANRNSWVELGIFEIENGVSKIILGDSTGTSGDSIAFDAMKFETATPNQIFSNEKNIPRIFPNPCNDAIHIETNKAQETLWTIFDNTGRKVQEGLFTETINSINTELLKPSLYILQIENSKDIFRFKFLKTDATN